MQDAPDALGLDETDLMKTFLKELTDVDISKLQETVDSQQHELTICRSWREVMQKIEARSGKVKLSMADLATKNKQLAAKTRELNEPKQSLREMQTAIADKENQLKSSKDAMTSLQDRLNRCGRDIVTSSNRDKFGALRQELQASLENSMAGLETFREIEEDGQEELAHLLVAGVGQEGGAWSWLKDTVQLDELKEGVKKGELLGETATEDSTLENDD